MRSFILGAVLSLLATGASAQTTIYQVRLPDGRVLFTDQPPPGAVIVQKRIVEPLPEPAPTPEAARPADPSLRERAAAVDERLRERAAQREEAYAAVAAAERELDSARQALESGREPQAGEMLGKVGGGARRGPAYEQRIAALEASVTAAEQKLSKARETLTGLR